MKVDAQAPGPNMSRFGFNAVGARFKICRAMESIVIESTVIESTVIKSTVIETVAFTFISTREADYSR